MASTPHLVLARKWRPERFSDLVGQEHVTRTLCEALKRGRIAHAFLFTGIRGVGKTTAARILARCLNCERGPTAEPCGECAACLEIRAGAALDVVEIDGATYRKIDDARAIIENLSYRPARDRFKIYIIDEAHQLTDQAFNALLKTLEEPPAHVKFILATTEPQKMPETILSRLQRYDFRRIPFAVIFARLKELTMREGAAADEAALGLLAREAGGSMRDAERMLETAIASLDGKVTEGEVASILGVASRSRVFGLIEAMLAKDAAAALGTIRDLHRRGANLESLGRDILEVLRNLAVAKLPDIEGAQSPLADLPDQEAAELRRIAAGASSRDLMRLFRLMADTQEQLIRSPYPDLLLEMAVIRMATLASVIDADELLRAIGAAPSAAVAPRGGTAPASAPPTPVAAGGGVVPKSGATQAAPGPLEAQLAPAPARRIRVEGEVKAAAPLRRPPPASAPTPSNAPAPIKAAGAPGADLPDLREFIRGRRAALSGFMEQGALLVLNGDVVTVYPRNDIYIRYLTDNRNVIAELASELYARRIRVEVSNDAAPSASPAAIASPAVTAVTEIAPLAPIGSASADDQPDEIGAAHGNGIAPRIERDARDNSAAAPIVPNGASPDGPGAANGTAAASSAELKQAVMADPVVRRIFDEFQARLVEVRPSAAVTPGDGAAAQRKR